MRWNPNVTGRTERNSPYPSLHAVCSLWSCCLEDLSSSCPDWEAEERETDSGLGPVSSVLIMAPGKHLGVLPIWIFYPTLSSTLSVPVSCSDALSPKYIFVFEINVHLVPQTLWEMLRLEASQLQGGQPLSPSEIRPLRKEIKSVNS